MLAAPVCFRISSVSLSWIVRPFVPRAFFAFSGRVFSPV